MRSGEVLRGSAGGDPVWFRVRETVPAAGTVRSWLAATLPTPGTIVTEATPTAGEAAPHSGCEAGAATVKPSAVSCVPA